MIFRDLDLGKYFMELLAYDDGSKRENIEYIMQVYAAKPEDILFIDDKRSHIDAVKSTGVRTLLFEQD
jgi:methionine salvage enolase-phosphatase E1